MTLKRVLGTLLASRMSGRGGGRGGLGSAAMLGMLGGGRRGGIGGRAGLAGMAFMAYQAFQAQQTRASGSAGSGNEASDSGGVRGMFGDLANRLGIGGSEPIGEGPSHHAPDPEAEQAAAQFSDEKALLLIRAMITAAHSDGSISPDERAHIMHQLDEAGADSEDRRTVEREIENPKSLDELLVQVRNQQTAQEFYLASRAAMDRESEAQRAYLASLRQRLKLSEAEVVEIEGLAP